jgi:hypothetical protein
MKIRFKKFEPTSTFIKLFGTHRDKPDTGSNDNETSDGGYEYYYKRGNTYYFRNSEGEKFSIDYHEPQNELIRGNRYKMDAINNADS